MTIQQEEEYDNLRDQVIEAFKFYANARKGKFKSPNRNITVEEHILQSEVSYLNALSEFKSFDPNANM